MGSMGGDWQEWLRVAVSCRGVKGHRAYKLQLLHGNFLGAFRTAVCLQPKVPKTRSSSTC